MKIFSPLLFLEILYYISRNVLGTFFIRYLMVLSKTMKVAIILMLWWYVYLFLTPRNPVLRNMPRHLMVILGAPYSKLYCLKIMTITKKKNKKNKIKNDPTQEMILYCNTAQKIEVFHLGFFSKCHQIRSFLRICSHFLKKSLIENFIFCAM